MLFLVLYIWSAEYVFYSSYFMVLWKCLSKARGFHQLLGNLFSPQKWSTYRPTAKTWFPNSIMLPV